MASDERNAQADLSRLAALEAEPTKYHVFQALRLIEAAYADRPRLGESRRPRQDPVRLTQEPELAFPTSTVASFRRRDEGGPLRLANLFFGLFGPHGPLPLHITEYARDRKRNHGDPTMVAFANVFHHRMASLLYRAWRTGEPAPSLDRPGVDAFGQNVAAFTGHRGAAFAGRDAMPDMAKRYFAGHLSQGQRSESGLLAMLSGFFRAPVEIRSFIGSWLHFEAADLWRLGARRPAARLGESTTLGARVWSRQSKFSVRIGPMDLEGYRRLLPGGESLRQLQDIIRNSQGDALEAEVNLVLRGDAVPKARLGAFGALGWTTWIGHRPPGRDADDLHLALPPGRATKGEPA